MISSIIGKICPITICFFKWTITIIIKFTRFKIPSINIGTRQDGKFKPQNVRDCKCSEKDIYTKILEVKNKKKLNKLENIKNPYEAKISTKKIIKIILNVNNRDKILRKKFIDIK